MHSCAFRRGFTPHVCISCAVGKGAAGRLYSGRMPIRLLAPLLLLVLVSGCGSSGGGAGTPGGPGSAGANTCPKTLPLTEEDNQTEVCVAKGGTVTVILSGTGQWKPVQVSGTGLSQQPTSTASTSGTAATFSATAAGTATITSSRNTCPEPSPGEMGCDAVQAFSVTVTVQ
jgi:hypothetical protein